MLDSKSFVKMTVVKSSEKLLVQEQLLQINQAIKLELKNSEIFKTINSLDLMNGKVDSITTTFNQLNTLFHQNLDFRSSLNEFKHQINEMEQLTLGIKRLKIVQQYLELYDVLITESNQQRLATLLKEIDMISVQIGQPSPIINIEFQKVKEIKQTLCSKGLENIKSSLNTSDATLLQQNLQIFINLNMLESNIQELINNFESDINLEAIKQFDAKIINDQIQDLKLTGKDMILNWAQILWNHVEQLLELVYASSQKVVFLQKCLEKQNNLTLGILLPIFSHELQRLFNK